MERVFRERRYLDLANGKKYRREEPELGNAMEAQRIGQGRRMPNSF